MVEPRLLDGNTGRTRSTECRTHFIPRPSHRMGSARIVAKPAIISRNHFLWRTCGASFGGPRIARSQASFYTPKINEVLGRAIFIGGCFVSHLSAGTSEFRETGLFTFGSCIRARLYTHCLILRRERKGEFSIHAGRYGSMEGVCYIPVFSFLITPLLTTHYPISNSRDSTFFFLLAIPCCYFRRETHHRS